MQKNNHNRIRGAVAALALAVLLAGCGQAASSVATPSETAAPTATVEPAETATPEPAESKPSGVARQDILASPEPTATPLPALATATDNATKDAPQVKDPSTWNDAGKATMEALEQKYGSWGMTLTAQEGYPYFLAVNRAASTVTVYTTDDEGRYTVPFMAMVCSGGSDTPTGYWTTPESYDWRLLVGPCYGQYATRIYSGYLFHSVPYYSQHKDDLEYDQFNQLGTVASLGCIRLAVVDVKWIYDNCPLGTPVLIYNDTEDPGPMGKPGTIYTDPADETKRGWDPTDPDPSNPWDDAFETGTTIRSQAAWDQWQQNNESWQSSLTPTDLQGWSTDSSVAGTRG